MDQALTDYFNELFFKGHPGHRSDKILASVMHHKPEFNKYGSMRLPHAWRALKGWPRLAPGSSRLGFPLAVWAAIATEMKRLGHLQMALFTMIGLSAYTRPGELLRRKVGNLI